LVPLCALRFHKISKFLTLSAFFQLTKISEKMVSYPMDPWSLSAFASGATAHLLLYRHGEWDVKSLGIFQSYGLLLIALSVLERMTVLETLLDTAMPTNWAFRALGYHILGLYSSMLFYRAFWHRLSSFPGPFLARLSNFYVTGLSAKKFQLYEEVEKLHQKHGDYVRLGRFTPRSTCIRYPRSL
jgi:hypothetical protein